jgi:hypothetical protein
VQIATTDDCIPAPASLALLEAAHVGFIFRDPTCHLVTGEFSRFRQLGALRAHPGGEKVHQLLFLFPAQCIRRRLNFLKLTHFAKISHETQGDNNSITSMARFPR